MLFTWDTQNLCIVFRQWHIRSTFGLIVSLLAVVALGAGYEALRAASRRYENIVNKRVEAIPSKPPPSKHHPPKLAAPSPGVRCGLCLFFSLPSLCPRQRTLKLRAYSRRWICY